MATRMPTSEAAPRPAASSAAATDQNKNPIEYARFVQQRRWFVSQFSYLLDQLAARPDPVVAGSTMLDTSVVLLCSELSDGRRARKALPQPACPACVSVRPRADGSPWPRLSAAPTRGRPGVSSGLRDGGSRRRRSRGALRRPTRRQERRQVDEPDVPSQARQDIREVLALAAPLE